MRLVGRQQRTNSTMSKLSARDKDQAAAFRKAARDLGCDDNEERFKDALRTVAKAKPEPQPKKRKPA
jgi:hypothetical protein